MKKNYIEELDDLVSIIVPVYNVSDYVEHCLESLVCQTYSNIEIIVIIDGSPDDSQEKCLKWQKKDARIMVVCKKNEKLGPTRTLGVRMASGKYIMFVDSDDWVENTYVEKLYDSICSHDSDFAFCDVYEWNGDKRTEAVCGLDVDGTTSFREDSSILFSIRPAMWNKIYKRSLFTKKAVVNRVYNSISELQWCLSRKGGLWV